MHNDAPVPDISTKTLFRCNLDQNARIDWRLRTLKLGISDGWFYT